MKISFNYEEKEFIVSCSMANGKEEIYINGSLVSQKKNFIHFKSVHCFDYEGASCEVRLKLKPLAYRVISVTLVKNSQVAYNQDFDMTGKAFNTNKVIFPKWAYTFVVLCGIIPFISLGGAVPAVLGVGGASVCLAISRKLNMSTFVKVALCTGVTILCWILFFILISLVQSLKKT